MSEVRAAARDPEADVRAKVFARDGRCLLDHLTRVAGGCMGRATFHHLQKASAKRGGYTVENGVCLCERHNGWVEDWPKMARRFGLVVGYDGDVGVMVDHEQAARRRKAWGLTPLGGPVDGDV